MLDVLTINLNERGYDCGICGRYGDHRHAVSIDACGQPTSRSTGGGRVVCKRCHDRVYAASPQMQERKP